MEPGQGRVSIQCKIEGAVVGSGKEPVCDEREHQGYDCTLKGQSIGKGQYIIL